MAAPSPQKLCRRCPGDVMIKEQESATRGGEAYLTLQGGQERDPDSTLTIYAGGIKQTVPLDIREAQISVNTPAQIQADGVETVQVNLTPAVAGVDVMLAKDVGLLSQTMVTTDANGSATVKLQAAPQAFAGHVKALIGQDVKTTQAVAIVNQQRRLAIPTPVLIGDAVSKGSIVMQDTFGYDVDIAYLSQIQVTVKGNPGETLDIALGGQRLPVYRALLHYPMTRRCNSRINGVFKRPWRWMANPNRAPYLMWPTAFG